MSVFLPDIVSIVRPRPSEIVLLAYFVYATMVALALPVPVEIRTRTVLVNLALLTLYPVLIQRNPPFLRDWVQLPLMLLGYWEMGWFALPHTGTELEEAWVVWDRWLLDDLHLRTAIESLGALVPAILEVCYTLVYTIAVASLTMLYAGRLHHRAEELLFPVMLATFASYALFPYFPSEPPRSVFPDADLPSTITVFRRFNHWMLGKGGIHTSVFPSAHVSTAFAAAFALRRFPEVPAAFRHGVLVLSVMIAISTVYGRYHFLADAVAGFLLAYAAQWIVRVFRFK